MEIKEKLEKIEAFNHLLIEGRKTGTIKFENVDQKLELKNLYESIYNVQANISCDSCVRFYLDQLEAFYDREYSKYLKTVQPVLIEKEELKKFEKITFEKYPDENIKVKRKPKTKKENG